MQKYARNMHKICSPNMQEYEEYALANKKFATYVHNKLKYAEICKNKICTYMQTFHMHKYAQNMHKYAKLNIYHICNIINMHSPLGWCSLNSRLQDAFCWWRGTGALLVWLGTWMLFPNSHGYQSYDPPNPRPDCLAAAGKVHGAWLPEWP